MMIYDHIADEDLQVETFYSKDLMLLLLNKLHISKINYIFISIDVYTYCIVLE